MLRAYTTWRDVGSHIYLRPHRRIGLSSQYRDLADVGKCVRERALEQLLSADTEWCIGRQISVEGEQRGMKSVDFLSPRAMPGLYPVGISLRHSERPIEEVPHMCKDFYRGARALAEVKVSEPRRRVALRLRCSICDGGENVAQERPSGIFQCQSGSSLRVST